MKKFLIVFACLFLLAAGVLVVAFSNANWIVSHYRVQVERALSSVLKQKVEMGRVEVGFLPDTRLRISEVRIGEEAPLTLNDVELHLALLPLLRKQVVINELVLDRPALTLVRTPEGVYVEGFERRKQTPAESAPEARAREANHSSEEHARKIVNAVLQSFRIQNATCRFRDEISGKTYELSDGEVTGRVAVENGGIKVIRPLFTGLLSGAHTISVKGEEISYDLRSGGLNLGRLDIELPGFAGDMTGSIGTSGGEGDILLSSRQLSLEKLSPVVAEFAPPIGRYALSGELPARLQINWSSAGPVTVHGEVSSRNVSATANTTKISEVTGLFSVASDGNGYRLSTKDLQFKMNGAPAIAALEARMNKETISASSISVRAFSGETKAAGTYRFGAPGPFKVDMSARGIDLGELLRFLSPGSALGGVVQEFHFGAAGETVPNIQQSMRGRGAFAVERGVLKDINIAGRTLQAINDLPFVQGALMSHVPPELQGPLNSPDTTFSSCRGDFDVKEGWLFLDNAVLLSDLYTIRSRGRISLDADLDLGAELILAPRLADAIVQRVKQVRTVVNPDGTLTIPLAIKGKGKKVSVLPDVRALAQKGAENALREKASDLVDKAAQGKFGKGLGKFLRGF